MKASTIKWHIARDNREKLHAFCSKHAIRSHNVLLTRDDGKNKYYEIEYTFDNGGYIRVELLHGTEYESFSIVDHFEIVDHRLGDW